MNTQPILAQDRAHAEQLAREHITPDQASQTEEFIAHSLAVPEYLEINGETWRRITLGSAGNIAYPE
jgi:hypothetical protein